MGLWCRGVCSWLRVGRMCRGYLWLWKEVEGSVELKINFVIKFCLSILLRCVCMLYVWERFLFLGVFVVVTV